MKPNMIVGALALTSVFMAGHLQAADGTVHFRGEIMTVLAKSLLKLKIRSLI